MIKLNKVQANAVINRLHREYTSLRDKLIKEEKNTYIPSPNVKKAEELIDKRDKLKKQADEAAEAARNFIESLGITFYNYGDKKDAINKIKEQDIENKYPPLDLGAALDNLIIDSITEDFDINNFIESYLKPIRK